MILLAYAFERYYIVLTIYERNADISKIFGINDVHWYLNGKKIGICTKKHGSC